MGPRSGQEQGQQGRTSPALLPEEGLALANPARIQKPREPLVLPSSGSALGYTGQGQEQKKGEAEGE